MAVESYQFFSDKPEFTPMFNPNEMLKFGIHEGCVFNVHYDGILIDYQWKEKGLLKDIETKTELYYSKPNLELNYYKVLEEMPLITIDGIPGISGPESIQSKAWLAWYIGFYYKTRGSMDAIMIQWWKMVITWAFTEATPSKSLDQMLLHYSWNPGWFPKILGLKEPNNAKP